MWKIGLLSALAFSLAACGEPEEVHPDPEVAAELGPAEELPRLLPPPEASPRYVGRWATAQENCDRYDWYFEPQSITTPGEVMCRFDTVEETETGYAIRALCTAEGPQTAYDIQLSFAESAGAMLVSGGPWDGQERGLVYCGSVTTE